MNDPLISLIIRVKLTDLMSLWVQSWRNVIDAVERHAYFGKKTTEYENKLISQTLHF